MLKTKQRKGINGTPCIEKIRTDKTGVEGRACSPVIRHYGHPFSFCFPEKAKN